MDTFFQLQLKSLLLILALVALQTSAKALGPEDLVGDVVADEDQNADLIVRNALEADLKGDADLRSSLLKNAIENHPSYRPARWQSGQLERAGQWMSVEDYESVESKTIGGSTYRSLRDQYSGTLPGEISLARWCRKHGLMERERFHWTNVIKMDASHDGARKRLKLREFQGRLMTAEQIADWKRCMIEFQNALDHWEPILSRWVREIKRAERPQSSDAWDQFTSVTDVSAVPALEKLLYKSDTDLQKQILLVLGGIDCQQSTDALVRVALNTDSESLRRFAASQISDRSWYGFVPGLLGRLETPVKYQWAVNPLGTGVYGDLRLSKEGPMAFVNRSHSYRITAPIHIKRPRRRPPDLVSARIRQQRRLQTMVANQNRKVMATVQAVERSNANRLAFNDRIYSILSESTKQPLKSTPHDWWDWWKDYNELDYGENKASYNFYTSSNYNRPVIVTPTSCFAPGTPVWTEIGEMPIEKIRRGDRVLSQNPRTGELQYHLVLGTTLRPPTDTLVIRVTGDQIMTTRGHPFWVVGLGWKMAKEIKVGDRLHSVDGGIEVTEIEPGDTIQAHNLLVEGSRNYFVGKHRLLVHDNTVREPKQMPLPGWLALQN